MQVRLNEISRKDIADIHHEVDGDFIPVLSSRVNINNYAGKLHRHAEIISVHEDDEIAGLLAIYCTDKKSKIAYISSICLRKKFRGRGIAQLMLDKSVEVAAAKGMEEIQLEVGSQNKAALKLYYKNDYYIMQDKEEMLIMGRPIERTSSGTNN